MCRGVCQLPKARSERTSKLWQKRGQENFCKHFASTRRSESKKRGRGRKIYARPPPFDRFLFSFILFWFSKPRRAKPCQKRFGGGGRSSVSSSSQTPLRHLQQKCLYELSPFDHQIYMIQTAPII